ncbi:hypothetical protein [Streptomyces sp. JB150]|uniref:hypothetical protein n=1 Tax=Streptomyces sp. JB150 TaxID=2714844 RepID=UPI00140E7BBF|nr:hypothetical protein [Streptomyces sp. JB150]QIJ63855.1 hypothetical protein G7Z13_18950 [Streptomyces sp. JB150]
MSLFSAPEGQPGRSAVVSPPPATNPFQAPDFGEGEVFPSEDESVPAPGASAVRPDAA